MRQSLLVREQQELKDDLQLQSKGDAERSAPGITRVSTSKVLAVLSTFLSSAMLIIGRRLAILENP